MSEAAKHTPGPWYPAQNDFYWSIECDASEFKYQCIADLVNSKCIISNDAVEYDHGEANAHLIAAAPELYEELRTSRCPRPANHRPDEFTVGECVNAGECGCSSGAAIAKAEGRQP